MEERLHNITLLGVLDDVLALEWKHNNQFGDDVCKLWYASLKQTMQIVKNINIDEWAERWRLPLLLRLRSVVFTADRKEFVEKGRCCLSVAVIQDVLEEGPHEMEIVEREPRDVCLFYEEQHDLSEIVSNE